MKPLVTQASICKPFPLHKNIAISSPRRNRVSYIVCSHEKTSRHINITKRSLSIDNVRPPATKATATATPLTTTTTTTSTTITTTTIPKIITTPPVSTETTGRDQIGVVKFCEGKNYFITGAMGFVAKVLVEKMLRTVPDIGKLFILIKAKDKETATKRLHSEIIESDLFKCIKQKYGRSYKAFMTSKLVPIVGNIGEDNLGIDPFIYDDIAKEVDVIISSAAITNFTERYDVALNTNTKGPHRLLKFAKKCKNLKVFLHISTAYANGTREGIIKEKPFFVGQTIGKETVHSVPILDIDAELKLASMPKETLNDKEITKKMKEMGSERANMYGWQNTYTFTKAMGEMVITSRRGDIPVVIMRPTVVESTYKEPFPGWIQGNKVLDPMIISYGKGQLPGFLGDPQTIIDIVPADIVVNAALVAMAKHGTRAKSEINVYHVSSSLVNPIRLGEIFKFTCDHFTSNPVIDSEGAKTNLSGMLFFKSVKDFSCYIRNIVREQNGLEDEAKSEERLYNRLEMKCMVKTEFYINLARAYEPYMFYKGWFDDTNTQKLIKEIISEEKKEFGFEMGKVNWEDYILKVHIPGLKEHILKGRLNS